MLLADQRIGTLLEPFLWIVGALLAGAVILMLFQWWKRRSEQAEDAANDQLAQFRNLYEEGEISEDEYKRLHKLLTARLHEDVSPEAPPVPEPAEGELKTDPGQQQRDAES